MATPGERVQLRLDYRPDLFDRSSVEALGERLIRLLEAAIADPDRAIGSLDISLPPPTVPRPTYMSNDFRRRRKEP